MKPKHANAYKVDARERLKALHIAVGQKYNTLSAKQLTALYNEAVKVNFRPLDASKRSQLYFEQLHRRAT